MLRKTPQSYAALRGFLGYLYDWKIMRWGYRLLRLFQCRSGGYSFYFDGHKLDIPVCDRHISVWHIVIPVCDGHIPVWRTTIPV